MEHHEPTAKADALKDAEFRARTTDTSLTVGDNRHTRRMVLAMARGRGEPVTAAAVKRSLAALSG